MRFGVTRNSRNMAIPPVEAELHMLETDAHDMDGLAPVGRTTRAPLERCYIGLLLGSALYLWANLFANPRTPFLLGGDQVFFWMDAQRMLHGEEIYRDFFQFTPPGVDLVYWSAFKLFGPRIWVPNLIVLVLGLVFGLLCWRVARSIMPRSRAALATALFLVADYGKLMNATHHWFSVLAVMGSVAVLLQGSSLPRIALAGALLGVASFFTQTRGLVAALGVAVWLLLERSRTGESWTDQLKRQMLLFASLTAMWFALSGYYIATVGLQRLWYFQVTYVRQYMVSGWSVLPAGGLRGLLGLSPSQWAEWLPAYVFLPGVYLACALKYRRIARDGPAGNAARIALLMWVGFALFAEVGQSPNWFRLYCVALPAVVLLIWLVGNSGRLARYSLPVLWTVVAVLAAHQTWRRHVDLPVIGELPAGRVAMKPLDAEKLTWLAARTKPDQFILQVGWPGVYLPLALRNPLFLEDADTTGGSHLGFEELSIRQLAAKPVQYVLWPSRLDDPEVPLRAFYAFLENHYRKVWTFSDRGEVWQREP